MLFSRIRIWVLLELVRGWTQNFTKSRTNLHLELHDHRNDYSKTDLRHQYGISVAETQTFVLTKCRKWQGAKGNGCFCWNALWKCMSILSLIWGRKLKSCHDYGISRPTLWKNTHAGNLKFWPPSWVSLFQEMKIFRLSENDLLIV